MNLTCCLEPREKLWPSLPAMQAATEGNCSGCSMRNIGIK